MQHLLADIKCILLANTPPDIDFYLHDSYHAHTYSPHTHTLFNGPLSGTTRVSRYQKGKTNLDFTEARDSEWPWHQLGRMQVCILLQTDNHASTPPLSFLQAECPLTNSSEALKATKIHSQENITDEHKKRYRHQNVTT